MKVEGIVEGRRLQFLIDLGCTHNFLDATMTAKLGCQREEIAPLKVLVANGNEMKCNQFVEDLFGVCKGICLRLMC